MTLTDSAKIGGLPQPNLTIHTAKVFAEYRVKDKQIFARDLTDWNNEPACYTESKRGLANAWATLMVLADSLGEKLTHRDLMNSLRGSGIKVHYWCMRD